MKYCTQPNPHYCSNLGGITKKGKSICNSKYRCCWQESIRESKVKDNERLD
jgi:hypothetical protein